MALCVCECVSVGVHGSHCPPPLSPPQAVPVALSPSPGRWHHLCVTWAAAGGSWRSFQDGVPRGAGGGLAAGHPLRPRGVLVLGQEQVGAGGRLGSPEGGGSPEGMGSFEVSWGGGVT